MRHSAATVPSAELLRRLLRAAGSGQFFTRRALGRAGRRFHGRLAAAIVTPSQLGAHNEGRDRLSKSQHQ